MPKIRKTTKTLLTSLLCATARGDGVAAAAVYDWLLENDHGVLLAGELKGWVSEGSLEANVYCVSALKSAGLLTEREADEICPWRSVKAAAAGIKKALQERSGKTWSVTHDRGTAYGWLTISAPPRRCTWYSVPAGKDNLGRTTFDWVNDPTRKYGGMGPVDRQELASLLGLEDVHYQGCLVADTSASYREYVDRAEGRKPYWAD